MHDRMACQDKVLAVPPVALHTFARLTCGSLDRVPSKCLADVEYDISES